MLIETKYNFTPYQGEPLEDKLKEYFGYNHFRLHQKEIIQALLKGEDVLAILPTGAGKSLCYQLPALLKAGTAIVISPLISLMQDQVVSLFKNGIPAAFLNSSLPSREIQSVLENLSDYKLLYISPERLADPQFIERLKNTPLSFFVVDEAHCISQWGHSFRVEYRKLSLLKQLFPQCPVIALTATATEDVEKDIQAQLAMSSPQLIKGSFDRPNLTIRLQPKNRTDQQLVEFLERQPNRSGIIYASTRKGVEATFARLQQAGYAVGRYHAGMSDQERALSQNAFLHDQLALMVATVAFGMGIHKPDVRFIVHLDMPRTLEQYYQEIGRAGRDGLPAECLMFYGAQDFVLYKTFLEKLEDPIIQEQIRIKTNQMYHFCTSLRCRRWELLHYFGEKFSSEECGACDNCLEEAEQIDGSVLAKKILSCVFRLRQNHGIKMVTDVLRGSKNQSLLAKGYQSLSTYGLFSDLPEQEVRYYMDALIHLNVLRLTEGEYPVLKWTSLSQAVLEDRHPIHFKKRVFKAAKEFREPIRKKEREEKEKTTLHYDEPLFDALRELRLKIAREEGVPPYVVFSDRSLQEMALYFPQTKEDFSRINGVGPVKWVKYGEKFLEVIRASGHLPALPKEEEKKETIRPLKRHQSMEETAALYQQGRSIEEIMQIRQLARSTIVIHLIEALQQGFPIDLSLLVSQEKQGQIKKVMEEVGGNRLSPIKEKLPPEFTYDEIRLVFAQANKIS